MKHTAKSFAFASSAAAILTLGAVPASADEQSEQASTELSKGEKQLAKILEGRVAGEPQRCIRNLINRQIRTIDETAYVFGRGDTIYIQRTQNPEDIDDSDTLVQRRFDSVRLCKEDQATTVERFSGIFTGVVLYEDFIPYTRVEDGEDAG